MRYWAFSFDEYEGPKPDIRMFIVYFDPKTHKQLNNSLGLEKGLIGVVNAFADNEMEEQNNVVLAHEILHTLGAADKYDPIRENLPGSGIPEQAAQACPDDPAAKNPQGAGIHAAEGPGPGPGALRCRTGIRSGPGLIPIKMRLYLIGSHLVKF